MNTKHVIKAAMTAAIFYGTTALAQTFTYNSGDLLAAFRQSGSPDLIVDLGSISQFKALGGTGSTNLSAVSSALNSTYSSLNGIYWSVFTYVDTTGSLGDANTLWYTVGRGEMSIPAVAPKSGSFNAQGYVIGEMGAVVDGAVSGFATNFVDQAVRLRSSLNEGGDPISYTVGVGTYGDFNGTLKGVVENYTGDTFAVTEISDLFQLNPGIGNTGTYLGSFSLANDGTFMFAVPEPSTWAMLGTGMLMLAGIRRFGRNN